MTTPEQKQRWYRKNRPRLLSKSRSWRKTNREYHAALTMQWRKKNMKRYKATNAKWRAENTEHLHKTNQKWYKENAALVNKKKNLRYDTNINFRLEMLLRQRIRRALSSASKTVSTLKLVGCSIEQLREWLEAQFEPGMSWANRGEWHIDHIKPCATFGLRDPAQQKQCFNFTNLQPLWATVNLRKGAKWQSVQ